MRFRSLLYLLPVLVLALSAPAVAAPQATSPPATVAATYDEPDFDAVRVAPEVTRKWELLLEKSAAWVMCLNVDDVRDTLQITEDVKAAPCRAGSARSTDRPVCAPLVDEYTAFLASPERVRFTVCAPGRAFLFVRTSQMRPPNLDARIIRRAT